jgi:hypothetical protein
VPADRFQHGGRAHAAWAQFCACAVGLAAGNRQEFSGSAKKKNPDPEAPWFD